MLSKLAWVPLPVLMKVVALSRLTAPSNLMVKTLSSAVRTTSSAGAGVMLTNLMSLKVKGSLRPYQYTFAVPRGDAP